ncbi:MAG: phenylalanine--tRNA ligase subunit beta [Chitinophagales bacterium]
MKISYNWLKDYLKVSLPEKELADLLTDIGLEVEGVEVFESVKGSLEGIVVGLVEECNPHPDADKLKVTIVNVGTGENLQIVCGAPNVAVGQKVPVALVGTTLYGEKGDSFVIKKAKLRGVESAGMICAEDELGLGDDHDGIMILEDSLAIGTPLNEVIKVEKDIIFEIGLTPNRSDAFHHIGVARDLKAALNFRDQSNLTLELPDTGKFTPISSNNFKVTVEETAACPRYAGVVIENLKVEDSPAWLQTKLRAIGQRPINNIVDITNYIMHEYGQPLHAFDMAQVGNEIIVKKLPEGAKFTTLDEAERTLSNEDLMICNGDGGMCMAGVFGGLHSGVKNSTTSIFLESAYFDPKSIRRTSTRHGLRTDAAIHFEKGIDPHITVEALKRAALLIMEVAGGQIASELFDIASKNFEPFEVRLNYGRLNKLAGVEISEEDVKKIFDELEISIVEKSDSDIKVNVPPYRADVQREADLIEEVMRIYGFNNIPIPQKLNASINVSNQLTTDQLYEKLAGYLVGNGFYEIMVNSITKDKYYEGKKLVTLMNNLNAELTVMRESMIYSGLEPIKHNINHRNTDCRFFELGKRYFVSEDGYGEEEKLSLWLTGNISSSNWNTKAQPVDHYYLKSIVENILSLAGLDTYREKEEASENFKYAQSYGTKKQDYVTFGLLKKSVLKKLAIEQPVYYAEFNWSVILEAARNAKTTYSPLPKYPSIRRDLALLVDNSTSFKTIKGIGKQYGKQILRDIDLFDSYQDKKMDADKKSYAISFIFRDDHKTLSDKEVDKIMSNLMNAYQKELNAIIR